MAKTHGGEDVAAVGNEAAHKWRSERDRLRACRADNLKDMGDRYAIKVFT
jgi:hypothetical protein